MDFIDDLCTWMFPWAVDEQMEQFMARAVFYKDAQGNLYIDTREEPGPEWEDWITTA